MKLLRRLLPFALAILVISVAWIWWNRPNRVDMAAYVPADSLVYLEANNLPELASGLTKTDAWHALASPAGIRSGVGQVGWLGRLTSWTSIGPAEAVVFARAQVAVAVMGFEAADGGDTLRIKPRLALVIESHTSAGRTRTAIERRVGDFANRAYDNPRVEEKDVDGVHWISWTAASGDRHLYAALIDSVAIVGNDETAVKACLAVRRGERPSLAGNIEMEDMRRRVMQGERLAFGFVSPQGAARIFEVAAAVYFGQVSGDPQAQSLAANILPEMARKVLGSVGWSTRLSEGAVEDQYFMSIKTDPAIRLRDVLALNSVSPIPVTGMLPADTYSFTRYSTREPVAAWRALNISISSQLDPLLAVMVSPLLKAALKPYGIDEPEDFLRAIGSEIYTIRLDEQGNSSVLVTQVRDEKALRDFVSKRLSTKTPKSERVGDFEMLTGPDDGRGAASFAGDLLLMGSADNIRRCLVARRDGRTLDSAPDFAMAMRTATSLGQAHVLTFTDDFTSALKFITFVSNQRGMRAQPTNDQELLHALSQLPFSVSETKMTEEGVDKRTRSSFGQLGVLATQFASLK
jgi:hypothetical protein